MHNIRAQWSDDKSKEKSAKVLEWANHWRVSSRQRQKVDSSQLQHVGGAEASLHQIQSLRYRPC